MTTEQLEILLKYTFKDDTTLQRALTHRSFLNESSLPESNERLEFLGDAVLELIISEYLYLQKPNEPEGILTAARSAIVRTETLAQIAKDLNLGEFLFMSKGEEKSGGRTNTSLLANTTESIIGAIYLDGGLKAAEEFVQNHLLPVAESILKENNFKDPKSLLQEKVQELGYNSPNYNTVSETGPDHEKVFTVAVLVDNKLLAKGSGKSKQSAQQDAAKKALEEYQGKLAPKAKS